MIPAEIEAFTTEGEKSFYQFLQSVAKPNQRYLCWHLPDIHGREPGFLLYSEDVCLIIFEVKVNNKNIEDERLCHEEEVYEGQTGLILTFSSNLMLIK